MWTYQVTRVEWMTTVGLVELNFHGWHPNVTAEQNLLKLVGTVNFFGQVEEVDYISGCDDSIFRRFTRTVRQLKD